MITETIQEHIDRTGKSQAGVGREIGRSPQAINNLIARHKMYVTCDPADTIMYVGYYNEYFRRKA
jgi:hypothetical protein